MADITPGDEGWDRWGTHVVLELQRLDRNFDALKAEISDIKLDVRELKVRFVMYGAGGGFIATIAVQIFLWWLSTTH